MFEAPSPSFRRPRSIVSRLVAGRIGAAIGALVLLLSAREMGAAPLRISSIEAGPDGTVLRWESSDETGNPLVESRDALDRGEWFPVLFGSNWPVSAREWRDVRPSRPHRFYRLTGWSGTVERGRLEGSQELSTADRDNIEATFGALGYPVEARYSVRAYRVSYTTVSPFGQPVRASGALFVPLGVPPGTTLPLLSYQHGTTIDRSGAPSALQSLEVYAAGAVLGSRGFVVVMPDYLGYGDSTAVHPYLHARSEAAAGVDMIRAGRALCRQLEVALDSRLFLCGYSQGGHATMALHRDLETFHAAEFPVTAVAPMAGPYDLSGATFDAFLANQPVPNPDQAAFLLVTMQHYYRPVPTLSDFFQAPYAAGLARWIESPGVTAFPVVPPTPLSIIQPALLNEVRADPNHYFRRILRENDVHRWAPKAPVRLYHCRRDRDVPFANSEVALASLRQAGARVSLIVPSETAGHSDCFAPSMLDAMGWFESFR